MDNVLLTQDDLLALHLAGLARPLLIRGRGEGWRGDGRAIRRRAGAVRASHLAARRQATVAKACNGKRSPSKRSRCAVIRERSYAAYCERQEGGGAKEEGGGEAREEKEEAAEERKMMKRNALFINSNRK